MIVEGEGSNPLHALGNDQVAFLGVGVADQGLAVGGVQNAVTGLEGGVARRNPDFGEVDALAEGVAVDQLGGVHGNRDAPQAGTALEHPVAEGFKPVGEFHLFQLGAVGKDAVVAAKFGDIAQNADGFQALHIRKCITGNRSHRGGDGHLFQAAVLERAPVDGGDRNLRQVQAL